MSKDQPIKNPLLFNALAISFILLVLPITIAYTANAQYDFINSDYTNSVNGFAGSTISVKFVENGIDMSDQYDIQENNAGDEADCSYVVPNWELDNPEFVQGSIFGRYFSGICLGDGSQDVINTNRYIGPQGYVPWQASTNAISSIGDYGFRIPQTHSNQNLSHGYIGTSGNRDFTWAYSSMADDFPNSPFQISNDTKYAFKQTMIDTDNSYQCDDSLFTNIITNYNIQFWINYQYIQYDFISIQENKILNPSGLCNPHMRLDFNFTSMQITEINQFLDNNYYDTTIIISIDNIEREDNGFFTNEYLPFAGIGDYSQTLEFVEFEDANVVQGLQNTALVLGVGMALIALASTAYWNPVVDAFRRFQQ